MSIHPIILPFCSRGSINKRKNRAVMRFVLITFEVEYKFMTKITILKANYLAPDLKTPYKLFLNSTPNLQAVSCDKKHIMHKATELESSSFPSSQQHLLPDPPLFNMDASRSSGSESIDARTAIALFRGYEFAIPARKPTNGNIIAIPDKPLQKWLQVFDPQSLVAQMLVSSYPSNSNSS